MKKTTKLYEGKAKIVYETEDKDTLIISYKDSATAFNGEKKGIINGKGEINNKISNYLFKILEKEGIPTHFLKEISSRETMVKRVEIIPLEVIVRNIAAGSFSKRLEVEEGKELMNPTLEFSYKSDSLGDPLINSSYAQALGIASLDEIRKIKELALKINEVLKIKFDSINLKLVDFKIEFGRYHNKVILADEISPDTCRLWDKKTNEKLDKDRFRRDLGMVSEAYQEVENRLLKE